jgi:hypothetical protein
LLVGSTWAMTHSPSLADFLPGHIQAISFSSLALYGGQTACKFHVLRGTCYSSEFSFLSLMTSTLLRSQKNFWAYLLSPNIYLFIYYFLDRKSLCSQGCSVLMTLLPQPSKCCDYWFTLPCPESLYVI